MSVQYKDKKNPLGLSGKWQIPLGNHVIDCFVWVNKDQLLNNVIANDEDVVACYVHNPFRKLGGGLFGEVHFIENMIDPGIVAHELTHAIFDWIKTAFVQSFTKPVVETICQQMETMTGNYWRQYYETFLQPATPAEPEQPVFIDEPQVGIIPALDEVSDVENEPEGKKTRKSK